MLFFGPSFFLPNRQPSRDYPKAPARIASQIVYCITREACQPQVGISSTLPTTTLTDNLAALPTYQFLPALVKSLEDPDFAFQRGLFRQIHAEHVDLPPPRPPPDPRKASLWVKRLPGEVRPYFEDGTRFFTDPLLRHITAEKQRNNLPHSQVYATSEQYALLLDKAEAAGMLHWSPVSQEDAAYSRLAQAIEMTLFSVSKSPERTRLISWPRIQNDATPPPPYTSLPNPSLFEAVRTVDPSAAGFFTDIANMFHNITLPFWMSRLLPMKPIPYSDLSTATQARISRRTALPSNTRGLMLRPTQATMPMGFKWAVYIAHTFVSSCFDQSFQLLKASRLAPPDMKLTKLRAEDAPFIVTASAPLLLHVIDDAVVVTTSWPPELIQLWNRLTRQVLHLNCLPVSEAKSSALMQIVRDFVTFIGCRWDLLQGLITPSPGKLEKGTSQAKKLLETFGATQKTWERITGRLVWFAMLNRPLLSCTASIYHHPLDPQQQLTEAPRTARSRELRTLTALLPLARVDVNLPIHNIVLAFDASTVVGAVTYAEVDSVVAEQLWAATQRARCDALRSPSEQLEEVRAIAAACVWKKAFIHY